MSKLISAINITPDGFCNHTQVVEDEEHHQFINELLKNADMVLLGRVTYELFESYWPLALKDLTLPEPIQEFARLINSVEKVVVSGKIHKAAWHNTTGINDLTEGTIAELKLRSKKNILLLGSPGVLAELAKANFIDEYYFSVHPMLGGKGKRLFEKVELNEIQGLKLTDTKTFKSGVVTLRYQNINTR